MAAEKKSFFGRLQQRIEEVLLNKVQIDEEMMEELEETLITSDISMETTQKIMRVLRDDIDRLSIKDPSQIKDRIKNCVKVLLDKGEDHRLCEETPLVILMVGVNGAGKTTSIAKIAKRFQDQGKSVALAAADTFRAAAAEQLTVWGGRLGINVISHQEGADPSAVIFDAIKSAKAKKIDVLICDTAGRLQTKRNLMAELEKMHKVIEREFPEANRETLLVIDAATGKNAVSQAKEFDGITKLSGIVLTKLDGTAKGGIVISISDEFDIPVKLVGTGEGLSDLSDFDPAAFADSLFKENENE